MNANTLRLDPKKISEAEPFILDEQTRMMLSAYAVPRELTSLGPTVGLVSSVELGYGGGKELPAADEALDSDVAPRVTITPGQVTDKVLRLVFDRPVPIAVLAQIAQRLKAKAITLHPAKRLSFAMTATLLEWVAKNHPSGMSSAEAYLG